MRNIRTPKDAKPYSGGGVGRCSEDRAFRKLHEQMNLRNTPGGEYQDAAKRLNLLLSGQASDVFAVDIYVLSQNVLSVLF